MDDLDFARQTLAGQVNDWPEHARRNAEAVLRLNVRPAALEEQLRHLRSLGSELVRHVVEDRHGHRFVDHSGALIRKFTEAVRDA